MNGPDLDDDDVLDDALRALGTPAAGRPAASAAAILAAASGAPAPVGATASATAATAATAGTGATVSVGVLGAAVVAALGAGGLFGFGAATALYLGATADLVGPASPPAQPIAGETVGRASLPAQDVERASLPAQHVGRASAPAQDAGQAAVPVGPASPPAQADVRRASAPAQPTAGLASASVGPASPPARPPASVRASAEVVVAEGVSDDQTTGFDVRAGGDAGPTEQAIAAAPVLEAEDEKLPRPEAREISSPVGVHHDPMRTLAVGLRVTSGGRAWNGTIDGLAPEIAGAVGLVAGGGPIRPRLRGDLTFGRVDARATSAASGLAGFAADVGPARMDVGVAGGLRWIAAKPGATDAYDDEAGWLVLGAGPSTALVVPRRGGDVFLGGEVLYSWLALDGAVERVPWFGVTAGIEFDPRD